LFGYWITNGRVRKYYILFCISYNCTATTIITYPRAYNIIIGHRYNRYNSNNIHIILKSASPPCCHIISVLLLLLLLLNNTLILKKKKKKKRLSVRTHNIIMFDIGNAHNNIHWRGFKLYLQEAPCTTYNIIMSYTLMIIFIALQFSKFGSTHTRVAITLLCRCGYGNKIILKMCRYTTCSLIAYLIRTLNHISSHIVCIYIYIYICLYV
jgi:hypothetical protein